MRRKLKRDEEKAMISGVLAGLANYFDQDPALFRVAAVAFLILTGFFPGILLYLAAWVMMPRNGSTKADYEIVD